VDGCEKRCAARATALYSNKPAASILLDDVLAARGLPQPQGQRRLSPESQPAVEALAEVIAGEVDHLMAARWSRAEGQVLQPETTAPAQVSTAECACGSGIPVTRVQVGDRTVELMALEPVLDMAFSQGLRDDGVVPPQLLDTVRLYNSFPAGEEDLYAAAVGLAWRSFCADKEQAHG
jgi:hypothetical protein